MNEEKMYDLEREGITVADLLVAGVTVKSLSQMKIDIKRAKAACSLLVRKVCDIENKLEEIKNDFT